MKYNYLLFIPDSENLRILFNDLNNTSHPRCISQNFPLLSNRILNFLCKCHLSSQINTFINLPLKQIWDNYIFSFYNVPINNNSICFIFYSRFFDYVGIRGKRDYRKLLLNHLRTKYKNCKIVLYYGDLINTHSFNINEYRQLFDLVISYDINEASNNNLLHFELPFSFFSIKNTNSLQQSDVFFIGRSKGRYNDLIKIYEILQDNNLNCDFYITDIPKKEQLYSDKISYNKSISYSEVLRQVYSSKCVLEILQPGSVSPTARTSEAICYGKKLLSNCTIIKNKSYYNPDYISIFDSPRNININFIKKDVGAINYNYTEKLSPLRLIEFINSNL